MGSNVGAGGSALCQSEITAGLYVAANAPYIGQHIEVAAHAHFAAGSIIPDDGDFANEVAELTGDCEDLDIKAPAVHSLARKDRLCCPGCLLQIPARRRGKPGFDR